MYEITLEDEWEDFQKFIHGCWEVGYTHCGVDGIKKYMRFNVVFSLLTDNPEDNRAAFGNYRQLKESDYRVKNRYFGSHPIFDIAYRMRACYGFGNGMTYQYNGRYTWLRWDLNTGKLTTNELENCHSLLGIDSDIININRVKLLENISLTCPSCGGTGTENIKIKNIPYEFEYLCHECYGAGAYDWIKRAVGE